MQHDTNSNSRSLCSDAKAMLVCLGLQATLILYVTVFISLVPDWFTGLENLIIIGTTAVGAGCAVGAARKRGWINRVVGTVGILWFGFLVAFAAVTILNRS